MEMRSWIEIFTLLGSIWIISAAIPGYDTVIYDMNTQPKCMEIERSRRNDCRWVGGLDMVDQIIEGGRIVAYKIQWFSGDWSWWFVPGVNDLDEVFNVRGQSCAVPYRANTIRRRWSMFTDHTHRFIICKPN